jgi:aryl-alcohol dehydrogenase-like predicted oxidoreductase
MTFGEQNSEAEGHAQLSAAADAGVNFIDTAELYPVAPNATTQGRTSEIVGTWLKGRRRDDFVVASKVTGRSVHMPWIPANRSVPRGAEAPTRLDGPSIAAAAEGELRRLQVDCIDLLQLHWSDRYLPHFGQNQYEVEPLPGAVVGSGVVRFVSSEPRPVQVPKTY